MDSHVIYFLILMDGRLVVAVVLVWVQALLALYIKDISIKNKFANPVSGKKRLERLNQSGLPLTLKTWFPT